MSPPPAIVEAAYSVGVGERVADPEAAAAARDEEARGEDAREEWTWRCS